MIKHSDVLVDEHDPECYRISLRKILDERIADVVGYISMEFGDPSFLITDIIMDDGTELSVGGEHDHPYLESDEKIDDKLMSIAKTDPDHKDMFDDED